MPDSVAESNPQSSINMCKGDLLMQVFYSCMTSSTHRGADRHGPGKSQSCFRGMRKDKDSTIEVTTSYSNISLLI